MNSTHAQFNISASEINANLKPLGTVCPPFWMLTVEWSGAESCLFWWRHRFQIASFSSPTLENSVFKKHRFQIAPLWRAFSNGSVFGDRFRRCSVDDGCIRSKTAPFSFENGLVWTGPQKAHLYSLFLSDLRRRRDGGYLTVKSLFPGSVAYLWGRRLCWQDNQHSDYWHHHNNRELPIETLLCWARLVVLLY